MGYIMLVGLLWYAGNKVLKRIDKAIWRSADRLAVRDWGKDVIKGVRRERKARWKRQTMRIALSFSPEEYRDRGDIKKCMTPRVVDIKEAIFFAK